MIKDICIIYFSRRPDAEQTFKKLCKSNKVSNLLIKELYQHGLKTVRKTGFNYVSYHEDLQCGNSFGERIANAIDETFRTYQNVIVVGNDCPNLNEKDIHFAATNLSKDQFCVGLTDKGGTYLIGLNKQQWNKETFIQLPWNTPVIGSALIHYLNEIGKIKLLNPKEELNHINDIEVFLKSDQRTVLWVTFSMLTEKIQILVPRALSYIRNQIELYRLFRGPPFFTPAF